MTLAADPTDGISDKDRQPRSHIDRLSGLADELAGLGMTARLLTPTGRLPSLRVANPALSRLSEDVYVGRGRDGVWWFWWPWAERIAPGEDCAAAAALIARVLRVSA